MDQIRVELDIAIGTVHRVLAPLGGVIRKDGWDPTGLRLSLDERVEIRIGLERGCSIRQIAAALGRAPSTVSREVNASGGRDKYAPVTAHRRAADLSRRPKVTKLASNAELCTRVVADLERLWSPEP